MIVTLLININIFSYIELTLNTILKEITTLKQTKSDSNFFQHQEREIAEIRQKGNLTRIQYFDQT